MIRHSEPESVRLRVSERTAAAQTSPMGAGGSTSRAGQTRDFVVDSLKQHKNCPRLGSLARDPAGGQIGSDGG